MNNLDFTDVSNRCDAKWRRLGWIALTNIERVIVLSIDFYYRFEADGFRGYYRNPGGKHAVEAVSALQELGATQASSALRLSNALFAGGKPPENQKERAKEAVILYNLPDSEIKTIDEEYSYHHESMYPLIDQFLLQHTQELRQSLSIP